MIISIGCRRVGFHFPPAITVHHLHLHVIAPAAHMRLGSRVLYSLWTPWFESPDWVLSRLRKQASAHK